MDVNHLQTRIQEETSVDSITDNMEVVISVGTSSQDLSDAQKLMRNGITKIMKQKYDTETEAAEVRFSTTTEYPNWEKKQLGSMLDNLPYVEGLRIRESSGEEWNFVGRFVVLCQWIED